MRDREERREEAARHAALARGVFESDSKSSVEGAAFYEDGDGRELELPSPRFPETEAVVAWKPLAAAVSEERGRVCVVDPANYTRPAGSYLDGAWDPESQLCAESNLLPILEGLRGRFHDANRVYARGGLNSDRALYIEDVVFSTGGVVRRRDVLAISPVNRRIALENHRSEAECDADMRNRVESAMRIAASRGADVLVTCAFGCGWTGNDPGAVADLFRGWIDAHPGQIGKVVFAIAGGPALDAFRERFPLEVESAGASAPGDADAGGEHEDEDERGTDIAPASDGRWVFD